MADEASHQGLKNICAMLADEEVKHLQVVENMEKHHKNTQITDVPVLHRAKEIFSTMKKAGDETVFGENELELYRKASRIEEESEKFYREKQKQSADKTEQKIFKLLADEEHKHFLLVDNIAELVEKPDNFLENAEMYRFDDYAGGVFWGDIKTDWKKAGLPAESS